MVQARFRRARLHYGHGTANAADEAAALVWHVMRFPYPAKPGHYRRTVPSVRLRRIESLAMLRIDERLPLPYLTGTAWFAGLPFAVDPRVLIPRSPLAELIEERFQPWFADREPRRLLDLGTGSGCIACAAARFLPDLRVDAVDVSRDALKVAAGNVRRHRLTRRVKLFEGSYFSPLGRRRYDIIISNPPYVSSGELRGLPAEFRHEPRLALAAGVRGLDAVRVILQKARQHLRPRGLLIVEVGNSQRAVEREWPRLPFLWLEFERGGGGVFMLNAEQLN